MMHLPEDSTVLTVLTAIAAPATKAVAGFFGALVSLKFLKDASGWERFFMVLGGTCLSFFVAPHLAKGIGWTDAEGLVGFLLGLFGMALVAKIYEGITALKAEDVIEYLKRFLPGPRS